MINRFKLHSCYPQRLDELGVSLSAVLRQAGLPSGLFHQEKALVTTQEFFDFWRAIRELSSDPMIGLKLGGENRVERYDPVLIAALSTQTFREALLRVSRYKQLTCPEKIHLDELDGECAVRFEWLAAEESEPDLLLDLCFAWIVSLGSRGTGEQIRPIRVEFERAEAHREIFENHFQCPVLFQAKRNAVIFQIADIDRPFLTYNAELLAMVAPQLEAELSSRLAEGTIAGQVKAIVKRVIAGHRPAMQDVARELRLSPRTLQRRLTEEGATFQQLLEDARRELAHHYLRQSALELTETAYLLGYEDANSFFRAFQNWEGTSPGQWRSLHQAPHPGTQNGSLHA
jgi:AraC-like DNA-binding protein